MGGKNYYVPGDYNVVCDVCSKKIKASESRLRWDGFLVCRDDYEMRHEQDFVQARLDKITVPFSRPRPVDVFVNIPYPFYWDAGYTVEGYIDGDTLT